MIKYGYVDVKPIYKKVHHSYTFTQDSNKLPTQIEYIIIICMLIKY